MRPLGPGLCSRLLPEPHRPGLVVGQKRGPVSHPSLKSQALLGVLRTSGGGPRVPVPSVLLGHDWGTHVRE